MLDILKVFVASAAIWVHAYCAEADVDDFTEFNGVDYVEKTTMADSTSSKWQQKQAGLDARSKSLRLCDEHFFHVAVRVMLRLHTCYEEAARHNLSTNAARNLASSTH